MICSLEMMFFCFWKMWQKLFTKHFLFCEKMQELWPRLLGISKWGKHNSRKQLSLVESLNRVFLFWILCFSFRHHNCQEIRRAAVKTIQNSIRKVQSRKKLRVASEIFIPPFLLAFTLEKKKQSVSHISCWRSRIASVSMIRDGKKNYVSFLEILRLPGLLFAYSVRRP